MSALVSLGIFSALSLNLILRFGLGLSGSITGPDKPLGNVWYQWAVLFLSVLLLWLLFSYVLSPLSLGFFEYFLLFPLSVLVCTGLELLLRRLFPRIPVSPEQFSSASGYDGLILAALVLTLRLAASFIEAVVISLGFSLGSLAVVLILREICRRSSLEQAPRALRGMPLTLISMGFLSLIFSSLAVILLHVLGVF
jgi:electron transport complex protein RnfA